MHITELEKTLDFLKIKLLSETNSFEEAMQCHKFFNEVKPLYLKAKSTQEQLSMITTLYEDALNNELVKFDRFTP